jgi:L-2,4-diaminobutyrate transaminase
MFGSEHYGLKPDFITIAKGLTSAYTPLSGSIVADRVWDVIVQGTDAMGVLGHGWTYSAHPLCAAAGIANLELVDELGLVSNAATVGLHLREGLAAALAHHPHVGEVRGEGLIAAVEFVRDRDDRLFFDPGEGVGRRLAAALLERGVIVRAMPQGDILGFAPPLVLTKDEAEIVISRTAEAVSEVLG